jgi:hypothetical protein
VDVNDLVADPARFAQTVAGHVAAFTEGTL